MSIINTAWYTMARIYNDTNAMPNELVGDTGFVLRLRREILAADPSASNFLLGMRIFESPLVPPGHFSINGKLFRYIKPTLDEMCAEARKYLAEALAADVEVHKRAIARSFNTARMALGVAQ